MDDDPLSRLRRAEGEPRRTELCVCDGRPPLKLMQALGPNPIHCLDCNLEVLVDTLGIDEDVVDAIAVWRNLYDAIDRLWLDSGPYEEWAAGELGDPESAVNKLGLVARDRIEKVLPCYYWVFRNDDAAAPSTCPSCRSALKPHPEGPIAQLLCVDCRLVLAG